ncbi:MAG: PepSY-associated TM helix domain-containing protein [Pseudomonadota bacterium]
MGVVLGWLLYLVNFSGSVAIFVDELYVWEEPASRLAINQPIGLQQIIDSFVEETKEPIHSLQVWQPSPGSRYVELSARFGEESDLTFETYSYDAESGAPVTRREGDGVALWLKQLHRYLAIEPKIIGRILVGLTGVYMLVLILSGIVTHQKIARDLFKIRWRRATRTKMRDLHNATGLWTLPFALVIAFTGIMVGAPPLMAVVAGLPMTGGDIEQLETVLAPSNGPTDWGKATTLVSADKAMQIVADTTDFSPVGVHIERYGHQNAAYSVLADSSKEMLYVSYVPVDALTGTVDQEAYGRLIDGLPVSVAARIFFASSPLHYGLYGPLILKVLYYVLGIVVSLCIAYGMLIYFERRLNGSVGHLSQRTYEHLSLVNSGLLGGLPLATLLVFYMDRLLMTAGDSRYLALAMCFVFAWLGCVIFAFIDRNARRVGRRLLAATAAVAIFLPMFDLLTAGSGFLNTAVLVIHSVVVCSGLCVVWYLTASHAELSGDRKAETADSFSGTAEAKEPSGPGSAT